MINVSIVFTKHAIERIKERYGPRHDIEIPWAMMFAVGEAVQPGCEFKVQKSGVTYICSRLPDQISIVTVY